MCEKVLGDFNISTILQHLKVKGNFKITRFLLSDSWNCDCNELSEFHFLHSSRDPQFHQLTTWQYTHTLNTQIHTGHASHIHKQCVDHCRRGLLPLLAPAAFVQYYCWSHEWFSSEQCICVYVCEYGEEEWVSSHAVCLKCVSSTSYQEQPWKCSCRAVFLSFCHGGSRHAPWPRCPRHLSRETGGEMDGWREGEGGAKKQKRNLKKKK